MHKLIGIFWDGVGISFHRNWHEAAEFKFNNRHVARSSGAPYDIPVTQWLHDKVQRNGDWLSNMMDRREALNYCPVTAFIQKCKREAKTLVLEDE
jgi:hypothetical protein